MIREGKKKKGGRKGREGEPQCRKPGKEKKRKKKTKKRHDGTRSYFSHRVSYEREGR